MLVPPVVVGPLSRHGIGSHAAVRVYPLGHGSGASVVGGLGGTLTTDGCPAYIHGWTWAMPVAAPSRCLLVSGNRGQLHTFVIRTLAAGTTDHRKMKGSVWRSNRKRCAVAWVSVEEP